MFSSNIWGKQEKKFRDTLLIIYWCLNYNEYLTKILFKISHIRKLIPDIIKSD